MFDMFITGMENENDMFDIDVKIFCVSTFLKIQTNFSKYRPNTDQSLTFFEKVCIIDQNYFFRPLCHHCVMSLRLSVLYFCFYTT